MKFTKLLLVLTISTTVGLVSCKPKDADIQAAMETKAKADADLSVVTVQVTDGVATLGGELKDAAVKAKIPALSSDVKGLKSTVDNTTVAVVAAPAQIPVVISADDPLSKSVTDATKDYPTVKASVNAGIIIVSGTLSTEKWKKLKMTLDGLHPKKVDGSALTIK